jgi:hypothetical protein
LKKYASLLVALLLSVILFSKDQQHEVSVINVVVPVRVFEGNRFVADLTKEDFEIYENDKLQNIESLYLVNKEQIERKEAVMDFEPQLLRNYYLIFQISEYNPRFNETIDYLFEKVLLPGDTLTIMTPMGNYVLPKKALKIKSKESLSKEMKSIVRKDTLTGAANYRSLLTNLRRLVRSISAAGGVEADGAVATDIGSDSVSNAFGSDSRNLGFLLASYRSTLQNLDKLRLIDENKFIQFARSIKRLKGQKNVFFFYEREFRPEISDRILGQMMARYQDEPNIQGDLQDLFQFYQRHVTLNVGKIQQIFADASIIFNFIFITKDPGVFSGINMREQSEDVFNVFTQVARATGGIVDNSQNPAYAFTSANRLTEIYYLLYYTPADYQEDGKFKNIKVKVKGKDYNISHRFGYIAGLK